MSEPAAPQRPGVPPRLAIVDDNGGFRLFVRRVAERRGWQVAEYPDGASFLGAVCGGAAPDLVLLDILMPEIDGLEVLGALGASGRCLDIAIVTGGPTVYADIALMMGEFSGLRTLSVHQKPLALARLAALLGRHDGLGVEDVADDGARGGADDGARDGTRDGADPAGRAS